MTLMRRDLPNRKPWDSNERSHLVYEIPVDHAIIDVLKERERQETKWGRQNHDPNTWISILGEEYGEACRASNEKDGEGYRKELIETAAVAVAAVEAYDRGYWKESTANASIGS